MNFFDRVIYQKGDVVNFFISPLSSPYDYYPFRGRIHNVVEQTNGFYYYNIIPKIYMGRINRLDGIRNQEFKVDSISKRTYKNNKRIGFYAKMTPKKLISDFDGCTMCVPPSLVFKELSKMKSAHNKLLSYLKTHLELELKKINGQIKDYTSEQDWINAVNNHTKKNPLD
jgi:hypothetical protein